MEHLCLEASIRHGLEDDPITKNKISIDIILNLRDQICGL